MCKNRSHVLSMPSEAGFSPGPWFQKSTTGKSNLERGNRSGKYDRRGNSGPPELRGISRISSIFGRLRTIEARRRAGRYRLLVDSGAAINIIKEDILDDQDERKPTYKIFLMGNDRHILKQSTKLKFFDQEHIFYIVSNDFPLPERGIIGIKFFEKYPRYAITNKYLVIDKVKLLEKQRQFSLEETDRLLKRGIIRESQSPYNSPLWIVPQKGNKLRMVIVYRTINEDTDQDAYPLPMIDDILDHLGKAKFFSAFDLSAGFH